MNAVALSLTFPGGSIDVRMDRPEEAVLTPIGGIAHDRALQFPSKPRLEIVRAGDSHVATVDHHTGLMWCVDSLGREDDPDKQMPQAECVERCRKLRLLGFDDWRAAETAEGCTILDFSRADIAVDPVYFPRLRPAWHWFNTPYARDPASCAWYVNLDYGFVSWLSRDNRGFALAVRRVGQ